MTRKAWMICELCKSIWNHGSVSSLVIEYTALHMVCGGWVAINLLQYDSGWFIWIWNCGVLIIDSPMKSWSNENQCLHLLKHLFQATQGVFINYGLCGSNMFNLPMGSQICVYSTMEESEIFLELLPRKYHDMILILTNYNYAKHSWLFKVFSHTWEGCQHYFSITRWVLHLSIEGVKHYVYAIWQNPPPFPTHN